MFNKLILLSAFSSVFMIVVILVAITNQSDFLPGYVLGATVSINLLLGFTFGTILQMKGEDLCNAIYELSWYLLTCSEQKKVLLMLMASQSPTVITCGKYCTADLSAYLQVYSKEVNH